MEFRIAEKKLYLLICVKTESCEILHINTVYQDISKARP